MSYIESLVASGAIRFFDTSGVPPTQILLLQDIGDYPAAVSHPGIAAVMAALEVMYSNSATFRGEIDKLSPQSALWIDFDGGPSANHLDDEALGVLGFMKLGSGLEPWMINANGFMEQIYYARTIAHEIAHAIGNVPDTTDPLDGSMTNPDYRGLAVKFENDVVAELAANGIDFGSQRTSYHRLFGEAVAPPPDAFGKPRESWTNGSKIDVVHVNIPTDADGHGGQPTTGYGATINTSSNTVDLNDLVIALDDQVPTDAQTILTGAGNDYVYCFAGEDSVDGGADNDYLDGGAGDDILVGGIGNDVLIGGLGADHLLGLDGDDFLFFDADDIVVNGGAGRDVAFAQGGAGVTVDLDDCALEVCVGTGLADDLTAYGNGQMLAGGGGADVLRVERQGTTGPAILWGGEGADEFRLAEDFVFNTDGEVELRMPAGILLATVTGLTELNFHLFDLAMLGLPQDFDWSQIDAVILNPDPEDRLFLGDEQQSVVMGSYQVGYDPASTLDYLRVVSGDYEDGGRVVDFFTAGFLGSGEYTVFAAGAEVWETGLYDYVNPAHAAYVESAHPDWDWWRGYLEEEFYLGEGMDFSIEAPTREYVDITYGARTQENAPPDGESVTYDLDGETYLHHVGVQSLDDVGTFMTTQHIGPWFFLGGQLDRAALAADATFTADMSGYFEELWL